MTDRRPLAEASEIATYLGTTPESLAQFRHKGTGPKFVKIGARVRYRWSDVEAWLTENTQTSTADRPGAA